MTRLVAIGDIHLHQGPRQVDRLRALDQIIDEGLRVEQLGAWLVPGDIFHSKSTVDDRNAFAARLQRMANAAPCLLTYGNHDQPEELDIFTRLQATWPIWLATRPGVIEFTLATGEAASCFALPYPHKGMLASLGVAHQDLNAAAWGALDLIFLKAAADLADARAAGDLTFMIGHANIAGSISSNGNPQIGEEIDVSTAHLDRLGPILKVFSHIHKAQDIGGAIYTGSICRLSWGETEPKRYLVVDLEGGQTFTVHSRPLNVPARYHVEGLLSRDSFEWVVKDGPDGAVTEAPTSWAGHEVRCRYRFAAADAGLLEQAKAQILAVFAEAAHLELEPVAIAEREVRAPQVVAAKTLRDKLDAWTAAVGLPASAGVQVKLAALENTDAAALLAGIQAQLAAPAREPVAA
jgi:hypothetical protein